MKWNLSTKSRNKKTCSNCLIEYVNRCSSDQITPIKAVRTSNKTIKCKLLSFKALQFLRIENKANQNENYIGFVTHFHCVCCKFLFICSFSGFEIRRKNSNLLSTKTNCRNLLIQYRNPMQSRKLKQLLSHFFSVEWWPKVVAHHHPPPHRARPQYGRADAVERNVPNQNHAHAKTVVLKSGIYKMQSLLRFFHSLRLLLWV